MEIIICCSPPNCIHPNTLPLITNNQPQQLRWEGVYTDTTSPAVNVVLKNKSTNTSCDKSILLYCTATCWMYLLMDEGVWPIIRQSESMSFLLCLVFFFSTPSAFRQIIPATVIKLFHYEGREEASLCPPASPPNDRPHGNAGLISCWIRAGSACECVHVCV